MCIHIILAVLSPVTQSTVMLCIYETRLNMDLDSKVSSQSCPQECMDLILVCTIVYCILLFQTVYPNRPCNQTYVM